jgi:hypothetical protein
MSFRPKVSQLSKAGARVAQATLPHSTCRKYTTTLPLQRPSSQAQIPTLLQDKGNGLGFIRSNPMASKPRKLGVTEIRGPYYSAYGPRHLQDLMETMGAYIDGLKFAGGSFSLFPETSVKEMIRIAHENGVYVSTVGS